MVRESQGIYFFIKSGNPVVCVSSLSKRKGGTLQQTHLGWCCRSYSVPACSPSFYSEITERSTLCCIKRGSKPSLQHLLPVVTDFDNFLHQINHPLGLTVNFGQFSTVFVSFVSRLNRKIRDPRLLVTVHVFCLLQTVTRGQSNLTNSASREAHSPVRGHPRGSKFVPLNS